MIPSFAIPSFFWAIFYFALAIAPLVFIHEMGHYLVGRWFGVHAEAFSIGFGRPVAGWTDKRGTRWQVGWMPLGGYVRFAGDMSPASQASDEWLALPPEARNRTFQAKPVWQRALIVAAGPITNFLAAIAIFTAVFSTYGEPQLAPTIAIVGKGSPAEAAGLRVGDRIAAIDGRAIERFDDIAFVVQVRANQPLIMSVVRDGRPVTLTATPRLDIVRDRFGNERQRGLLGIGPGAAEWVELPLAEIPAASLRLTAKFVRLQAEALAQIVTGQRSVKELQGPVGTAEVSRKVADLGIVQFILFMGVVSINLGFINLLPIPMLDGGHLAFYAIEAVRGRAVGAKTQDWAYRSGLAMLLAFMVLVTVNDLAGLGLWKGLAGLIG